ncbi:MAG TPA: CRISPR-associated endonuclease Cas2 [Actinobacteria bacterium]|jgi:CRISPR-associated protein Cas2|nr:CRISPR-associated endonuclease Cas2 [Actinomycetota bacterium]
MLVLISYDVNTKSTGGQRRLRHVAKICENYGQRVQFSIFECIVDPSQWVKIRKELIKKIDPEKDSLRFYFLGSNWKHKIEHIGAKETVDFEGPLVI